MERKEQSGINLFVDMDGTLARFYEKTTCLEDMYTAGYFRDLNPYETLVQGLVILRRWLPKVVTINALSACLTGHTARVASEKTLWLEQYFPLPRANIFFVNEGENKAEHIKPRLGSLDKKAILLDDYNLNLEMWQEAGGTSIKFVNEINDLGRRGPLWTGMRIRYDFDAYRIAYELFAIIHSLSENVPVLTDEEKDAFRRYLQRECWAEYTCVKEDCEFNEFVDKILNDTVAKELLPAHDYSLYLAATKNWPKHTFS